MKKLSLLIPITALAVGISSAFAATVTTRQVQSLNVNYGQTENQGANLVGDSSAVSVPSTQGVVETAAPSRIRERQVNDLTISNGKKPEEKSSGQYDRPVRDDKEIAVEMNQTTLELNALLQSTLNAAEQNFKSPDFQLEIIASDFNNSKTLLDTIGIDADVEAEYRKRQIQVAKDEVKSGKFAMTPEQQRQSQIDSIFPVITAMKPTRLPSRKIEIESSKAIIVQQPIAVIGADEYSLAWFKMNVEQIKLLNARVVVTQVKNIQDFQAIRNYAPELDFVPTDARLFLSQLKISIYPIIVTPQGAYQ